VPRAILLVAGLAGGAPAALAHGGPEKVIGERFVVAVSLVPVDTATRLRFFFRDFRSGRGLGEPVSLRVRVLGDGGEAAVCDGPATAVRGRP
jgi:hypothetical protein